MIIKQRYFRYCLVHNKYLKNMIKKIHKKYLNKLLLNMINRYVTYIYIYYNILLLVRFVLTFLFIH